MSEETTNGTVYCVRFPDGSIYVGGTTISLSRRRSKALSNARNGWAHDEFHEKIVEFDERLGEVEWIVGWNGKCTREELAEKETSFIRSMKEHYGDKVLNYFDDALPIFSADEETKKKCSEFWKGRPKSTRQKERMKEGRKRYMEKNPPHRDERGRFSSG